MNAPDYRSFLEAKVRMAESFGFDIEPSEVNPKLKPHQIAIVVWAVAGGRRAIFCAFGLGKTVIQLETERLTRSRAGGMAIIVIPLGVRQEFIRDAAMLGIKVKLGRRGRAVELNPAYFLDGSAYCKQAELESSTPSLFDFEETAA